MAPLLHEKSDDKEVRPSLTAGIYFPADRDALDSQIARLLKEAARAENAREQTAGKSRMTGRAAGAIVPHAAYDIAGPALASGLLPLTREPRLRRVVILAPVHRDPFAGCVLPCFSRFRTPLGDAEIDRNSADLLLQQVEGLRQDDTPFLEEHDIELPLPFLQHINSRLAVLPILFGNNTAAVERIIRRILGILTEKDPLEEQFILISSNLTGYVNPAAGNAQRDRFLSLVQAGEGREIIPAFARREISACGAAACAAFFRFSGGWARQQTEPTCEQPEKNGRLVHYWALQLIVNDSDNTDTGL